MKKTHLLILCLLPLCCWAQRSTLGIPLGHKRAIHSLSFSADGTRLLSGSADGTLKLWDVATGKLLKSSQETNQAVLGSRLSPDGNFAAYSWSYIEGRAKVWDIQADQQIDLATAGLSALSADGKWALDFEGNLLQFPGLEKQASAGEFQAQGFTPDGKSLYQATPGQLMLYDISTQKSQKNIPVEGLTEDAYFAGPRLLCAFIYNADTGEESTKYWKFPDGQLLPELPENHTLQDISSDGRYLLLTEESGDCKLFDLEQKAIVQVYRAPTDATGAGMGMMTGGPSGLSGGAISPDGRLVVWGQGDGRILAHDRQSGRLLYTLEAHSQSTQFLFLSSDKSNFICSTGDGIFHFWDFTRGRMTRSASFETLTTETLADTDQLTFFATPADQQRASLLMQRQGSILLKDEIYLIGVADDGSVGISFELKMKDGPIQDNGWPSQIRTLDLTLWDRSTKQVIQQWEGLQADNFYPGMAIFSPDKKFLLLGENDYFIERDVTSRLFDLEKGTWTQNFPEQAGDITSCLAFSPDGKQVLSGSFEGLVNLFDAVSGRLLHSFEGHKAAVNMVSFSADGQKIFSTSEDASVKIWDVQDKKEVASLIHIDKQDWIVLSPDGLFDASQNAMNLLYYLVENKGKQEIVELEQLKARFYEPGLLQKLMGYSDERSRSVEGIDQVALYPEVEAGIEKDQLNVQLQARSGGIGPVSIFANGKEIANDANPQRSSRITYDLKQAQHYLFRHPDSTNIISLRVYNQAGWLKSSSIDLVYQPSSWSKGSGSSGNSGWTGKLDPKMYVVSIGTSDYTGTQLDLQYATQDATSMALALQAVGSNLFSGGEGIEVHCLSTAPADATGLEGTPVQWQFASKENLQSVLTGIKQTAKAEDVLLVYLSGHGLTHGGAEQSQFYYLTSSIASEDMISDADVRNKYTISSSELTEWINDIAALKQVLVIDACNSGKVVENLTGGTRNLNSSQIRALDRMKDRTGMFILSGSAADKVSYEASEYGQGLLTYALLQGMLGVATRKTADGDYVDIMKLFQYARDEVPRLAATINGIQTPMLGFPKAGASFDIGIFDQHTKIPIGNKKPVIIRPNFLNQATLKDDLGLVKLLETKFRKETEKGKDAGLIYVDVTDYPGAYSLSGLYTKEGANINMTIKLFENGQNPKDLDIQLTDDPEKLVRYIVREVKRVLSTRGE